MSPLPSARQSQKVLYTTFSSAQNRHFEMQVLWNWPQLGALVVSQLSQATALGLSFSQ